MSTQPCSNCGSTNQGSIAGESVGDACPDCGARTTQFAEGSFSVAVDSLEFDVRNRACPDEELPKRIGRFRIESRLGRGGFGNVYRAYDPNLDRNVALKVTRSDRMRADTRQQMLHEARVAAQLRHRNIVAVHEVELVDHQVCIVTDLIEGKSLASKLKEGKVDLRTAVQWCVRIARALQYAHERGVIHRDLKPANILLDQDCEPMVTDFGLAKRQPLSGSGSGPTEEDRYAGSQTGTPGYMSPEQAASMSHEATAASDIFSMGVILYELFAGQRPFSGTPHEIIRRTILDDPVRIRKHNRSIPAELEAVCMRCLEKSPERRYASAGLLADDLERYQAGNLNLGGPLARLKYPARQAYRHRIPIVVGVLLAVLVLLGLWQYQAWLAWKSGFCAIYLETEPRGAEIVMIPVDPVTGQLREDEAIRPSASMRYALDVPEGYYLVEAYSRDHGVRQVFRTVRKGNLELASKAGKNYTGCRAYGLEGSEPDGRMILPRIEFDPPFERSGYVRIERGSIEIGGHANSLFPQTRFEVIPFEIDSREVTVGEFREVMGGLPMNFKVPEGKTDPDPASPVTAVSYREALEFMERVGARLPELSETLFACTNGGTTDFPWGDKVPDESPGFGWADLAKGLATFDRTQSEPPVEGLYSSVWEWTTSPPPETLKIFRPQPLPQIQHSDCRIVAGACPPVSPDRHRSVPRPARMQNTQIEVVPDPPGPRVGMRCYRSVFPRFCRGEDSSAAD